MAVSGRCPVVSPGELRLSAAEVGRERSGFDPAQAAPKDAVHGLTTPVLLVHPTTDEVTPSQHSEAIFANSDQRHTRLELTRYGAPLKALLHIGH